MSHWVKCTDSKSDETVYVNIDNAMSVTRDKKGDTIIAFPGGKDDYVAVKESAEELFEAKIEGTASACCNSPTVDQHHHAD
jgi:hypothetical protein